MYSLIVLSLAAALSCPVPQRINKSKFEWNMRDTQVLKIAQKRCGVIYPDAPCLIKFFKLDEHDYGVICGRRR